MPVQLRIYTINRGALDEFAREWEAAIKPLRIKIGFQVLGAWKLRESNQFAWIIGYDGPKKWEELDLEYHRSPERHAMDPDPARNIARMEHFFMDPLS
ncbi:MAG: NIPSNAP family protein [Desulfobulbaceae bacterium]|nr:NIPSNAP family protein [Desulfobulbaceae bacterium]